MGSYFLPGYPGQEAFNNSGEGGFRDVAGEFGPYFPGNIDTYDPGGGGDGGGGSVPGVTFTEPPSLPPISRDDYGGREMPFDNSFVSARGSLLGTIIRAGTSIAGAFLPGQTPMPCAPGDTRLECMFYGPQIGGDVIQVPNPLVPSNLPAVQPGGCRTSRYARIPQCVVPTKSGKKRRGSYKVVNGQVVCCPLPRRLNPLNVHALNRAARRLKGFTKVEARIHKALRKACGTRGRGRIGASRAKKCCR